jgi:hypothetical protein
MADQKPASSPANGTTPANTNGNSTAGAFADVPILRIPTGMLMLSKDQETNGRTFEGTVGIKYGPEKSDWLRLSYMEMKKIIDFCREHKEQFNTQLKLEREKMATGDL